MPPSKWTDAKHVLSLNATGWTGASDLGLTEWDRTDKDGLREELSYFEQVGLPVRIRYQRELSIQEVWLVRCGSFGMNPFKNSPDLH